MAINDWMQGDGTDALTGSTNAYLIDNNITAYLQDPLDLLLKDYLKGCELSYASASTINVGVGSVVCENSGGTIRRFRRNTSAIVCSTLDTGSLTNDNWYYVYAVADSGVNTNFTAVFSLSSTFPTGITYARKIGAAYYESSSFVNFRQFGDTVYYVNPYAVADYTQGGADGEWLPTSYTSFQTKLLKRLPINFSNLVYLKGDVNSNDQSHVYMGVRDSEQTSLAAGSSLSDSATGTQSNLASCVGQATGGHNFGSTNMSLIYTVSGSLQVAARNANTTGRIWCFGYKITRL